MKNTFNLFLLLTLLSGFSSTKMATLTVSTVSANTTLTSSNHVVICTQAAPITLTLPAASSNSGVVFQIVNHGVGTVTLSPAVRVAVSETMSGISPNLGGNTFEIISDGTTWRLISQ
jgi:hypothetical protein